MPYPDLNTPVPVPLWFWLSVLVISVPPTLAWWRHTLRLVVVSSASACRTAKRKAHQRLRDWIQRIMQDPPDER